MQDVPQVLLLMSGGQFLVVNVGSFDGAHIGIVHSPRAAPAPPVATGADALVPGEGTSHSIAVEDTESAAVATGMPAALQPPPPPRLQIPADDRDDSDQSAMAQSAGTAGTLGRDPEVLPDTATARSARGRGGTASEGPFGDDEDVEDEIFDDENENDRENTSPPPERAAAATVVQPLAPSGSQHVRCFQLCNGRPLHTSALFMSQAGAQAASLLAALCPSRSSPWSRS